MSNHGAPASASAELCQKHKPRLRRVEASAYLERTYGITVAVATLATMSTRGGGPRFCKFGRVPLYPLDELDSWAAARIGPLRSSSSEEG